MFNQFDSLVNQGTITSQRVVELGVVVAIGLTYWKSRAAVQTVAAALLGGFVLWVVHNTGVIENKVGEDLNNTEEELGAPSQVLPDVHDSGWSMRVARVTDAEPDARPAHVLVEFPERVEW